ncbi:MAG: hypothetical protein ACLTZN_09085 [Streptococcus sp.]
MTTENGAELLIHGMDTVSLAGKASRPMWSR